jgi:large subunit ribosomal protein L18
MLSLASKNIRRQRIHTRIRSRVRGLATVPRLNIYRSLKHIYANVVDDARGQTLLSASSVDKEVRQTMKTGGNVAGAKVIGKILAERAKAAGITKVVFDRGGYAYHGRVKALADAAREAGLKF